jgi:hypothetical protein
LYIYYINFTEDKVEFNTINKQLKEYLSELKYKFSNIICNYKLRITNLNINTRIGNTKPTVDGTVIDLNGNYIYNFKIEDFINNYADNEKDPYYKVIIYPQPVLVVSDIELYYLQPSPTPGSSVLVPVTNNLEILISDVINLKYIHESPTISNTDETDYNFKFRIGDISPYGSLYSEKANIQIINSVYEANLPATIGDISITSDNRAITTLTLTMFTVGMQPPYNDPEGDLIDAIRIDSISNANQGIFYYDGNPIQVGDIISREDIQSGLFIHNGANIDTLSGDSITFSGRDEINRTWVQ